MAKNDTATNEFEGIELDTYTPDTEPGAYDKHVRAMLKADEKLEQEHPEEFESGKRTSVKILTANDDKAKAKTIREFQDSARAHNRTGRKISEEPQGTDGQLLLRFILVPKQHRPRKAATEPTGADVPTEIPAADTAQDAPEESAAA